MNPRITEVRRLLNDFMGDLGAAVQTRQTLESPLNAENQYVRRMCLSQAILTLLKWFEFSKTYKALLPEECLQACQALEEELQARRIQLFRHRAIGRMVDKKSGAALTGDAIDEYLDIVMKGDETAFWAFIGTPSETHFPKTVLSIAKRTYTSIKETDQSADSKALSE
jgi:hypothetical protein